jgi:voltage-gated potassium channel Kch
MGPDERTEAIPPKPVRQVRAKVPVARAWNNFALHPSSVRKAIRVIVSAYISAMLIGGLVIWIADPTDYPDPWRAFWYVLQTITTVGYGDAVPAEPVGKLIGALIMLLAIASLSILTAFITSAFVEARQAERRATADAEEAAHRQRLESRLTELVERMERIERQQSTGS